MTLHFYFLIITFMYKKFSETFSDTSVWILNIAKKWNDLGAIVNDTKLYDYQLLCAVIERTITNNVDNEFPLTFKAYYA
jgi:hypothetical protein